MSELIGIPSPYTWDAPFRYSQATRVGDLLFVSGQAAVGPDGQIVGELYSRITSPSVTNQFRITK